MKSEQNWWRYWCESVLSEVVEIFRLLVQSSCRNSVAIVVRSDFSAEVMKMSCRVQFSGVDLILTLKLSSPPVVIRPRTWLSIQSHPPKRITNPRVPKWCNDFLQLLGCGIGHPQPFPPNYGQILLGAADISLLLAHVGYIKIYFTVRSSAQIDIPLVQVEYIILYHTLGSST